MLRNLLAIAVVLALPAVLSAQAPQTGNQGTGRLNQAGAHGTATQVLGEVVVADELDGANNQEGVDEADAQNNDGEFENGEFGQEGVDEPDGLNNDLNVEQAADQAGDDQDENDDTPPAPPSMSVPLSRVGRHVP